MTAEGTRGADTRQALIDAAWEVFVRRGFARATTREIAEAAGVAEGTIYRHFDDKRALFRGVFFHVAGGMIEEFRRLPERAGEGTVRANLEYLFALAGRQQHRLSALMASMWADPELAAGFREEVRTERLEGFELAWPVLAVAAYIRAEQELGRIRQDVDALEAAATVVAVPFAHVVQQTLGARTEGPAELPAPAEFPAPAEGALDILVRGLAPSAGD
jgi:AcrR family transcriptional regulator